MSRTEPSRRWLLLGTLAWASGLSGCVVAPYGAYYRPVSPHGGMQYRRANCQGRSGPNTGATLDLGDGLVLEILGVLDRGDQRGLSIRLTFVIPPQNTLALAGPITLVSDTTPLAVRLTDTAYGGRAPGPGDRWQAGEPLGTGLAGGRIELTALVERPGDMIRIVWPAFQRNGRPLVLPELALQRRTLDGGLEPFNC